MTVIDRTAWNALVDDSGQNLDGSIWNKAAIKTVVLDPADAGITGVWKNITSGMTFTNDSGVGITLTVAVNRYRKIGDTTVVWQFTANPFTFAAPSGNLYLSNPPFSILASASCAYPVAWASFPAFVQVAHSAAMSIKKADGTAWPAASGWVYFSIILEASGG